MLLTQTEKLANIISKIILSDIRSFAKIFAMALKGKSTFNFQGFFGFSSSGI